MFIFLNLCFFRTTSRNNSIELLNERVDELNIDKCSDFFINSIENSNIDQGGGLINPDNSESYLLCLCIDKSNFSMILSKLFEVLSPIKKESLFFRRLGGLINVSDEGIFYFWVNIPAVLQYAYTNVNKPPVSVKNFTENDYLVDMMEFHPSNKNPLFKMHLLDEFITDDKPDICDKDLKTEDSGEPSMKRPRKGSQEEDLNVGDLNNEFKCSTPESHDENATRLNETCFFCISDSINTNIDYNDIGNVIKKKIPGLKGYLFKPLDIYNDSFYNFRKQNKETYELLSLILFNKKGFPIDEENLEDILNMKRDDFVEHIRKIIMEKITTLGNRKFEPISENSYLNSLTNLKYLEENEWNGFVNKYKERFENDTNRYIFLQLNKNNYDTIKSKLFSSLDLKNLIIERSLFFRLIIENSCKYNFFIFEHLEKYDGNYLVKNIHHSKQKVLNMLDNFLKYTKIGESIKENSKSLFLDDANLLECTDSRSNETNIALEKSKPQNIDLTLLLYEKSVILNHRLFFGFECNYSSKTLFLTKISFSRLFLYEDLYNEIFIEKSFYPFSFISNVNWDDFFPVIKLNIREYLKIHDFNDEKLNFDGKFKFSHDDLCLPFEKIILNLKKYVSDENSRYNRFFVIDDNLLASQVEYFPKELHNRKINLEKDFLSEKIEKCGWDEDFLKTISYESNSVFNVLLYRYRTNFEKEICVLKIMVYNKKFFNEIVQKAFKLFDLSYQKVFEESDYSENIDLHSMYISNYLCSEFSKARLIDEEWANKFLEILDENISEIKKIKIIVDILVDRILDKNFEEFMDECSSYQYCESIINENKVFMIDINQKIKHDLSERIKNLFDSGELGLKILVQAQIVSDDSISEKQKIEIVGILKKELFTNQFIFNKK